MLKKEPDFSLLAAFGDGELIIENVHELKPQVILLDLGLADQNSFELVNSLIKEFVGLKIIIMDLIPVQEEILKFVESRFGFILKMQRYGIFNLTLCCRAKKYYRLCLPVHYFPR
jgi:DNA-binding NarL/FixJ family response regulator